MAIKTFGLAQKIRVSRESGNTTFIFFRPNGRRIKNVTRHTKHPN